MNDLIKIGYRKIKYSKNKYIRRRVFYKLNEKGKVISWLPQKKSGLKTKKDAMQRWRENYSLRENVKYTSRKRDIKIKEKFVETDYKKKDEIKVKLSKSKQDRRVQYCVKAYYNNNLIVARSLIVGTKTVETPQDAVDDAWRRFLTLVGEKISGKYDEDEGKKQIHQLKNIKEGWIEYVKR